MVKYLPDMCDNLDSQRIPITGSDRKTGSIPYYGASGVVDYVEKYIFDEELLLVSEDGANLVMRNSPIAFSVSGKTWVNNHAHVLRFSDQWLRQYVELYLNSISLEPYITGTAQPKLNQQMLNNIPIPVPDESQIRYIVTCTTCVHKLISLRKQQIAKLDELVKARFVEMFDAASAEKCKMRIADYADVLGGYAFKSDEFCTNGIPVVRISNISNGIVRLDDTTCFSEEFWLQNKRFRAKKMDILMAMSGATTGKAGLYRDNRPALINQRVACIRAIPDKACPEFLFVATQLEWMYDRIQETSAGCAQPNISGKQIEDIPVPYASYADQKQFAAFVAQTDQQKLTIQQSLDKLELMKKALMQKYFG